MKIRSWHVFWFGVLIFPFLCLILAFAGELLAMFMGWSNINDDVRFLATLNLLSGPFLGLLSAFVVAKREAAHWRGA